MGIPDLSGRVIENYEIKELLGKGGFGAVYRARQKRTNRDVAFKVLQSEYALDDDKVRRFKREAEIVTGLEHPHIVPVYDYGSDYLDGGETLVNYIVMRLLKGGTLSARLDSHGIMSLKEVVVTISQLASALEYAHRNQIIHRDVKPNNVMFDEHNTPFIVDFGLAKLLMPSDKKDSTSKLMGTFDYMAPEQWTLDPIVSETDQYALGVMVFEMLTNRLPFEAEIQTKRLHLILYGQPTKLREYREEIPVAVEDVVIRALSRAPADRFKSVTEFAQALDKATTQRGYVRQSYSEEEETVVVLKMDVNEAIKKFYEASKKHDWESAKAMLGVIRRSSNRPAFFDVNRQERQLLLDIDREQQYDVLRIMALHETAEQVGDALEVFWQTYPEYDPENLARFRRNKGPVEGLLPDPFEWCVIESGFVMLEDASKARLQGTRGGRFKVNKFHISKFPVTNAQYQVFVDADDGYCYSGWWDFSKEARYWRSGHEQPTGIAYNGSDLPRTNVCWFDAMAFCRWLCARTKHNISLPTEQEWQRAAQGNDNRRYPWGGTFDRALCNSGASGIRRPTPVTEYIGGESPFQVRNMSGNVWEMCLTKWGTDGVDILGEEARVVRGGSYLNIEQDLGVNTRFWNSPSKIGTAIGFRLVWRE